MRPRLLGACAEQSSNQAVGSKELRRDRGRALTVQIDGGVHHSQRLGRELGADGVEGLLERGALPVEDALVDHERDVLETEDVLRIAEQRESALAQLAVRREG